MRLVVALALYALLPLSADAATHRSTRRKQPTRAAKKPNSSRHRGTPRSADPGKALQKRLNRTAKIPTSTRHIAAILPQSFRRSGRLHYAPAAGESALTAVRSAKSLAVHRGTRVHVELGEATFSVGPRSSQIRYDAIYENRDGMMRKMINISKATGIPVAGSWLEARFTAHPHSTLVSLNAARERSGTFVPRRTERKKRQREERIARFAEQTPLTHSPPPGMFFHPSSYIGERFNPNGLAINILTPSQFKKLPKGAVVYDVLGDSVGYGGRRVVGLDRLNSKPKSDGNSQYGIAAVTGPPKD